MRLVNIKILKQHYSQAICYTTKDMHAWMLKALTHYSGTVCVCVVQLSNMDRDAHIVGFIGNNLVCVQLEGAK